MEKDTQYSHFTKNADFTELKIRLEKDSRKKKQKTGTRFSEMDNLIFT